MIIMTTCLTETQWFDWGLGPELDDLIKTVIQHNMA